MTASGTTKDAQRVLEQDLQSGKENEGVFVFRTLSEVQHIANLLASLCPNPTQAEIGICELMLNAVEHGNLGISGDKKSELKQQDCWHEEIERRLDSPAHGEHCARIAFQRQADKLVFKIEDEGTGFDWHDFLDIDPTRCEHLHGRGIALARTISFDTIEYQGCGNRVTATIKLSGGSACKP